MAGQPYELLDGGMSTGPSLNSAPGAGTHVGLPAISMQPHHGVVGIVLVAVLVLFLLDKAGFRFAVTAGKR